MSIYPNTELSFGFFFFFFLSIQIRRMKLLTLHESDYFYVGKWSVWNITKYVHVNRW